jgi:4-amino-4-deoxy-L-arabinose transferase-like glycosyltransferase
VSVIRLPAALDRRLLWILVALCLADFIALAPRLLYADLNLDYPFVDGDSYDWIANGLRFAGHDVRYSGRPPLLPLALAVLDRLGALHWWPLLGLAFFFATVVGFYTLAARLYPAAAAVAAALALLACHSLQGLALDVMADVPASCLILWSAHAFLTASRRPRRYAWSGFAAGLASLTQPVGLLVLPAAAATLWARRRGDLRTRWPWIGAALTAACLGIWALVRRLAFAPYGDALKDPWRLFGLHFSAVRFYVFSLLSMLGLPACLLLVAGIVIALRTAWRGRDPESAAASLFTLLLFAGLLGFIVFFYRWEAKRFVVYAVWPGGLLVAAALSRLARMRRPAGRACLAAVSALAIGGAALPLPAPAADYSWAALCPLPPLAAHLELAGGPVSAPSAAAAASPGATRAGGVGGGASGDGGVPPPGLSVVQPRFADLVRWTVFGRAAAAWAQRPRGEPPRPGPARFAGAGAALYLFDRPDDGGGRYRTITRLSNALRKPVRFVPRSALAPYWGLLAVSPLAQLTSDYTVYQVRVQGLAGSWLLVTPGGAGSPGGTGGRPLGPPLLQPAQRTPAAAEKSLDPGVKSLSPGVRGAGASAAAEAAAIAAWVGAGYSYVALFPSPSGADPAELYLYFLLRSTELYVVEPAAAPATRALLGRSPVQRQRRFGTATALATSFNGQRTAVIAFDQ